jgi:predicted nucleic acid-binding Zn ribbon protein
VIKKIGDLLRAYLTEKGWSSGDPFSAVFLRWTDIAGDELGSHARPVEIERDILIVEADHPGWAQTVGLRKTKLLAALNEVSPSAGIRDLRVRLRRSKG